MNGRQRTLMPRPTFRVRPPRWWTANSAGPATMYPKRLADLTRHPQKDQLGSSACVFFALLARWKSLSEDRGTPDSLTVSSRFLEKFNRIAVSPLRPPRRAVLAPATGQLRKSV